MIHVSSLESSNQKYTLILYIYVVLLQEEGHRNTCSSGMRIILQDTHKIAGKKKHKQTLQTSKFACLCRKKTRTTWIHVDVRWCSLYITNLLNLIQMDVRLLQSTKWALRHWLIFESPETWFTFVSFYANKPCQVPWAQQPLRSFGTLSTTMSSLERLPRHPQKMVCYFCYSCKQHLEQVNTVLANKVIYKSHILKISGFFATSPFFLTLVSWVSHWNRWCFQLLISLGGSLDLWQFPASQKRIVAEPEMVKCSKWKWMNILSFSPSAYV